MQDENSTSLTEVFAKFACGFHLEDAPEIIVSYAQLLLLDLLGCALGGLGTPEQNAALAACQSLDGGAGKVAMWGTSLKGTPRNAAMFNGIMSHVLELDDFLGIDHTGAVVLPALFAVAEHENDFDEVRFLEAMILGYGIGRRMLDAGGGYSKHNSTGWHTTGTLGAYAAAVATSKYLGLTQAQMVSAIGLSGSVAGGTWAFSRDGSMSKRFNPGNAAQSGITAAYLAREGFTGPRYVIEAEWGGYFSLYAFNHTYDLRLGWTGIKPYACCRGCHSAIDVIHQMRSDNQVTADSIDAVLVTCSASQYRQLGKVDPATVAEAQLSLPFAIALALQFDTIGIDRFTDETITSSRTLELARLVRFDVKDDWTPWVEPDFLVTTRNSDQFKGHVPAAKGDPKNPMTTEQVVLKFRQLVSDRLGVTEQDHLIAFGLSHGDRFDLSDISEILSRPL